MARVSARSSPRNASASRAATSASEGSGSMKTSPHVQRRMRRAGRRWSVRARRSPHAGQRRWGSMARAGASTPDRGAVKAPRGCCPESAALDQEPPRTARTKAALLLPPLLPNASTRPYEKVTYHAPDGSETLDVDDQ